MDHNSILVFGVEIDQGDKGAALVESDRSRLRHTGNFPTGGEQNRIAESVDGAIENQIPSFHLVGGILERAGDPDVGALFVVCDRNLQWDGHRVSILCRQERLRSIKIDHFQILWRQVGQGIQSRLSAFAIIAVALIHPHAVRLGCARVIQSLDIVEKHVGGFKRCEIGCSPARNVSDPEAKPGGSPQGQKNQHNIYTQIPAGSEWILGWLLSISPTFSMSPPKK